MWSSFTSDARPIRYVKQVWEQFQDILNNKLREINVGDRETNVISADNDKKYAGTSDKNYKKNREGIKVFVHPNKRKRNSRSYSGVAVYAFNVFYNMGEKW